MALTDEQKEFIKILSNFLPDIQDKAKELFPEVFEPELYDFTDAQICRGGDVDLAVSSAKKIGIPRNHGLFFNGYKMKNPKLTELSEEPLKGWVLTFEKNK